MMKRLNFRNNAQRIATFVAVLFAFCSLSAQELFTERLRKSSVGEGRVSIVHDAEIDALVNGVKKEAVKPDGKNAALQSGEQGVPGDSLLLEAEKPMVARMGYRIQIYSGGNSRDDKLTAEKMQAACLEVCPELPVYVSFVSPRWICRAGNFVNQKAAENDMEILRKSGKFKTLTLVRCKILVAE